MTIRILFFFFIAAILGSCSSSGKLASDPENRLVFGNGGGFTGAYTTHELKSDGRVFIVFADSSQQLLKKLHKKQTHEIFNQAEMLKDAQPAINQPYNMTWFIRYYAGNQTVEYKWGDPGMPVAAGIKDLYNQLSAIVK